jgi:hypothetical protein
VSVKEIKITKLDILTISYLTIPFKISLFFRPKFRKLVTVSTHTKFGRWFMKQGFWTKILVFEVYIKLDAKCQRKNEGSREQGRKFTMLFVIFFSFRYIQLYSLYRVFLVGSRHSFQFLLSQQCNKSFAHGTQLMWNKTQFSFKSAM